MINPVGFPPLYHARCTVRSSYDPAVPLHVEVLLVRQNRVAPKIQHLAEVSTAGQKVAAQKQAGLAREAGVGREDETDHSGSVALRALGRRPSNTNDIEGDARHASNPMKHMCVCMWRGEGQASAGRQRLRVTSQPDNKACV